MVEESEERLSEEQIEELIQTVTDVLPGDPEQENAAPADTEMDDGGEQSWHHDGPELEITAELDGLWLFARLIELCMMGHMLPDSLIIHIKLTCYISRRRYTDCFSMCIHTT